MAKAVPAWLAKLLNTLSDADDPTEGFATTPAALPPSGGTGSAPALPPHYASAGLHINLVWDSSVTSSPNASAFMAAIQSAVSMLEAAFSNPVTLNIAVGWGEYLGNKFASPTSAVGGGWSYKIGRAHV